MQEQEEPENGSVIQDPKNIPPPPILHGMDGEQIPLHPVKMNAKANIAPTTTIRHMRSALRRNLPHFFRLGPHKGEAALIGTGPSVEGQVDAIRERQADGCMIFAIKGSHDWLIERGIMPNVAVAVDGQEKIAKLYQKPDVTITYLISSQCHPLVYDALDGYNVVVWNCYTKKVMKYWQKWLKRKKRNDTFHFVAGGSTSGLRSITLAYLMGFRRINLFGFDSCLNNEKDQLLKITGEKNEKEMMVVVVDDRHFFCDPAMSCQGNELMPQVKGMTDMQIMCWGDGFIPYVVHQAACRGDWQFVFEGEDWWKLDDPRRGSIAVEPDPELAMAEMDDQIAALEA